MEIGPLQDHDLGAGAVVGLGLEKWPHHGQGGGAAAAVVAGGGEVASSGP